MTELFLDILSLSLSASWLAAAAMVIRLVLPKAPKAMHVALWGLVALRLLLPVSFESALSLVPEPITSGSAVESWSQTPVELPSHPVISIPDTPVPPVTATEAPQPPVVQDPVISDTPVTVVPEATLEEVLVPTLARIWALGAAALAAYALVSHLVLWWQVRDALHLEKEVYRSAFAPTAFVLGWLRPRIYVPSTMKAGDLSFVVAHERAHIARLDHWWKPLGFLLLAVHWFNPLMWASYILLCRDIELACDERVIRALEWDQRADYSQTLLNCSIHRRMILACPTAFGMTGTKERVKNVLNYQKPGLWISLVTVIAIVVSLVCFFAVPPAEAEEPNPATEPTTQPTEPTEPIQATIPAGLTPVTDLGTPHTGSVQNGQVENEYGIFDYTLYTVFVTPTGLRYGIRANTNLTCYRDGSFWVERQTENGWETLEELSREPQEHYTMRICDTYDNPFPTSWNGWTCDWSAIYGVLEPGSYRLCTTVMPDVGVSQIPFTIGDPGDSECGQALTRYYEALDRLLTRESYHIRLVNTHFTYENLRSGDDYLCKQWDTGVEEMYEGLMFRNGLEYRTEPERIDHEEHGEIYVAVGWDQNVSVELAWFTEWVYPLSWTMDQIAAYALTEDSSTFFLRYTDDMGELHQETVAVYYDENGDLKQITDPTIPDPTAPNGFCLDVLDTTAEQIRNEIYSRNVEFYHSFDYSVYLDREETLVERDFVNTEAVTVENVTQAIERAKRETGVYYDRIRVYYDEARHIWRVDFEVYYGKSSTESIYMDENGITLRITHWPPNDI